MEAIAALVIPNAVARIGAGKATAADAEIETALADLIDSGGLFGGADGMTERQDADAGADPQACGAGRDRGGQHERHRGDRRDARAHGIGGSPVHGEVALGQPDTIEPLRLRDLGDGHRFGKGLFLRSPLAIVTFHHQADMHVSLLYAVWSISTVARLYCALLAPSQVALRSAGSATVMAAFSSKGTLGRQDIRR